LLFAQFRWTRPLSSTPSEKKLDPLVEESSQFRPHLRDSVALPSGTYPGWKCPQLAVPLTLGVRRRLRVVNLFQYRDDLLEFDSGDLSRAAQTVENWFGVPVGFGGLSLRAFGGLELTGRLKVMSFMHSPDFSGSSQSHFMSISYFFRGLDRDNRSIM